MSEIDQALLKLNVAMQASDQSLQRMQQRAAQLKTHFAPATVARREFNNWSQSPEGRAFKEHLFEQQQGCCAKASCIAGKLPGIEYLQIDHIQPLSKYPELALEHSNFQLLCGPCNREKSDKTGSS